MPRPRFLILGQTSREPRCPRAPPKRLPVPTSATAAPQEAVAASSPSLVPPAAPPTTKPPISSDDVEMGDVDLDAAQQQQQQEPQSLDAKAEVPDSGADKQGAEVPQDASEAAPVPTSATAAHRKQPLSQSKIQNQRQTRTAQRRAICHLFGAPEAAAPEADVPANHEQEGGPQGASKLSHAPSLSAWAAAAPRVEALPQRAPLSSGGSESERVLEALAVPSGDVPRDDLATRPVDTEMEPPKAAAEASPEAAVEEPPIAAAEESPQAPVEEPPRQQLRHLPRQR